MEYVKAGQSELVNTYSRIAIYAGFRLWKVGHIATLQIGFHNKEQMLENYFLVQLPDAFKPAEAVSLYDMSGDGKYKLGTDGVIRSTTSIPATTITRIITTYYCA